MSNTRRETSGGYAAEIFHRVGGEWINRGSYAAPIIDGKPWRGSRFTGGELVTPDFCFSLAKVWRTDNDGEQWWYCRHGGSNCAIGKASKFSEDYPAVIRRVEEALRAIHQLNADGRDPTWRQGEFDAWFSSRYWPRRVEAWQEHSWGHLGVSDPDLACDVCHEEKNDLAVMLDMVRDCAASLLRVDGGDGCYDAAACRNARDALKMALEESKP